MNFFEGCNTEQEIKKRFQELTKIYHPDNNGGNDTLMKELNRQYENINNGNQQSNNADWKTSEETRWEYREYSYSTQNQNRTSYSDEILEKYQKLKDLYLIGIDKYLPPSESELLKIHVAGQGEEINGKLILPLWSVSVNTSENDYFLAKDNTLQDTIDAAKDFIKSEKCSYKKIRIGLVMYTLDYTGKLIPGFHQKKIIEIAVGYIDEIYVLSPKYWYKSRLSKGINILLYHIASAMYSILMGLTIVGTFYAIPMLIIGVVNAFMEHDEMSWKEILYDYSLSWKLWVPIVVWFVSFLIVLPVLRNLKRKINRKKFEEDEKKASERREEKDENKKR